LAQSSCATRNSPVAITGNDSATFTPLICAVRESFCSMSRDCARLVRRMHCAPHLDAEAVALAQSATDV